MYLTLVPPFFPSKPHFITMGGLLSVGMNIGMHINHESCYARWAIFSAL